VVTLGLGMGEERAGAQGIGAGGQESGLHKLGGAQADLVPRNLQRTLARGADGQLVLGVAFQAGRDANDRTIRNYSFRLADPAGNEVRRLEVLPSSACRAAGDGPATCRVDLLPVHGQAEAESFRIEAGLMARIAVLLMKDAGTIQGGQVCEVECAKDCKCYPCSTGDTLACHEDPVSSNALAALQVMAGLHLHEGWVTLVPREVRTVVP
jgi:hypothetical protein